jgi:hypothetical protein
LAAFSDEFADVAAVEILQSTCDVHTDKLIADFII